MGWRGLADSPPLLAHRRRGLRRGGARDGAPLNSCAAQLEERAGKVATQWRRSGEARGAAPEAVEGLVQHEGLSRLNQGGVHGDRIQALTLFGYPNINWKTSQSLIFALLPPPGILGLLVAASDRGRCGGDHWCECRPTATWVATFRKKKRGRRGGAGGAGETSKSKPKAEKGAAAPGRRGGGRSQRPAS